MASRFREWNDVSPVTAKIIVVALMQVAWVLGTLVVWIAVMATQMRQYKPTQTIDFHEGFLYIILGLLAALSGVTLVGRSIDRVTDYGYVERKNAGKMIDAQAPPRVSPQVNAGDNAQINVSPTAEMPAPVPVVVPVASAPAVRAPRVFDPGV